MQTFNDISITHLCRQGMIFALDIVTKNANFSRDCYAAALAQGLLIRPIGNTVYLMPPYTINHDEVDHAVQASIHAVSKALK
jgi:adenosylmethionine---8-amino-7-oxononanoate aminotransferase